MWRTSPTEWLPLPSPIDGICFPNITVVSGSEGGLSVVVSKWRDGHCTEAHLVEFDRPEAYCSVDEAIYSMRTSDSSLDSSSYLRVAPLSLDLQGLADTRAMLRGSSVDLKQYLFVGLSECLEVVCATPPKITVHPSYDAALANALGGTKP